MTERHRLSTRPAERPARDGKFMPRGRKPNNGPFPRYVRNTTPDTRIGNPNLSSSASTVVLIKR
ncbi:hypothetical protein A2U01_0013297 [Trifolium medium]|uniref:Uncharacterized protein n=1 Tax=Trifolium medium TaxID=97028 RepID=A0A392MZL4_9FABA|nr:hypothetical protein [Trifolium medium]